MNHIRLCLQSLSYIIYIDCNLLRIISNFFKFSCCFISNYHTSFNRTYRIADKYCWFFCSLGTVLSQNCYLVCNNCKAFSSFACSCCLNWSIKCKKIRSWCNLVNCCNNLVYLLRCLIDFIHRFNHILHSCIACNNLFSEIINTGAYILCTLGILVNLFSHISDTSSQLFNNCSLICCTLCKIIRTFSDLSGSSWYFISCSLYSDYCIRHTVFKCNKWIKNVNKITFPFNFRLNCKVTLWEFFHWMSNIVNIWT